MSTNKINKCTIIIALRSVRHLAAGRRTDGHVMNTLAQLCNSLCGRARICSSRLRPSITKPINYPIEHDLDINHIRASSLRSVCVCVSTAAAPSTHMYRRARNAFGVTRNKTRVSCLSCALSHNAQCVGHIVAVVRACVLACWRAGAHPDSHSSNVVWSGLANGRARTHASVRCSVCVRACVVYRMLIAHDKLRASIFPSAKRSVR